MTDSFKSKVFAPKKMSLKLNLLEKPFVKFK